MSAVATKESLGKPVFDLDMEIEVLACVMSSLQAAQEAMALLETEDFFSPVHQEIFKAAVSLIERKIPPDPELLEGELSRRKKLKEVGGRAYLLDIVTRFAHADHCRFYCDHVREKAVLRRIQEAALDVLRMVNDPDVMPADVAAASVAKMQAAGAKGFTASSESVADISLDILDEGIPTFLPCIDDMITTRGMPCGQVTVVKAETGVGKTALMTQFAVDNYLTGKRVLYATFADLNKRQLFLRMVQLLTGFAKQPTDLESLRIWDDAVSTLRDRFSDDLTPIMVYEGRSANPSSKVESFASWVLAEHSKNPWNLVVVDYLQKMKTADERANRDSMSRVPKVAEKLADLAEQLGPKCATCVGSQVTKQSDGKNRSRYGVEMESEAGLVIEWQKERTAQFGAINVEKCRFGPTGKFEDMKFDFNRLRLYDPRAENYPAA